MTKPRDKVESKWFTVLRGMRVEAHKASTKKWAKRMMSKARRRGGKENI